MEEREPTTYTRRTVLRAGALGAASIAAGGLLAPGLAEADVTQQTPLAPGVYALNAGWLFGPNAAGAQGPGYGEGSLATVALPHTAVSSPLSWSNWDHATWEEVWIYRKHVSAAALAGGRAFVDFQGAMTSATVYLNGTSLGTHLGGYLPFSVELTEFLQAGDNVLAVVVDGTLQDLPPSNAASGDQAIDYLQPAGLYRDVSLRIVPEVFVSDVFAEPVDVLSAPGLQALATIDAAAVPSGPVTVTVAVLDGTQTIGASSRSLTLAATGPTQASVTVSGLSGLTLWSPSTPKLYGVQVTVAAPGGASHTYVTRTGFRTAEWRSDGFYLNGSRLQIFGLNRHQHFPYAGMAAPARLQRRDAEILRTTLNCNMVRCSHYPQSDWFLDACDELGLMVWEEPPGWGYVGQSTQFQNQVRQDMTDLVTRDRSRPSLIVWATRLNETTTVSTRSTGPANEALYAQTGQIAAKLDGTRQTTGAMNDYSLSGWQQQVFAYDDYTATNDVPTLKAPITEPYFVSESIGALSGAPLYRWRDPAATLALQADLHAQVHSQAGQPGYAGLLGWAGIDYDTLDGTNINDTNPSSTPNARLWRSTKQCGVLDVFRAIKPGASVYQGQAAAGAAPFVVPAFFWDAGSLPSSSNAVFLYTNCASVRLTVSGTSITGTPSTDAKYANLAVKPTFVTLPAPGGGSPDLLVEGLNAGQTVVSLTMSSNTSRDALLVELEDAAIVGDGTDGTRFRFRQVDAYGNQRHGASGTLTVALSGPAVLQCDSAFDFGAYGGVGGGLIRSAPGGSGTATLTVTHSTYGPKTASLQIVAGSLAAAAAGPGGPRVLDPEPVVAASAPTSTSPSSAPAATSPAGSTPTPTPTPAPATSHATSPAQMRALLRSTLGLSHAQSRLAAILRSGHTATFHAPSAGRLVVGWYRETEVEVRGHRVRRRVLVATATVEVHRAGRVRVRIRLTARGRTLLKAGHGSERVEAEASFTPRGGRRVSVERQLTLRR